MGRSRKVAVEPRPSQLDALILEQAKLLSSEEEADNGDKLEIIFAINGVSKAVAEILKVKNSLDHAPLILKLTQKIDEMSSLTPDFKDRLKVAFQADLYAALGSTRGQVAEVMQGVPAEGSENADALKSTYKSALEDLLTGLGLNGVVTLTGGRIREALEGICHFSGSLFAYFLFVRVAKKMQAEDARPLISNPAHAQAARVALGERLDNQNSATSIVAHTQGSLFSDAKLQDAWALYREVMGASI
jgi:hypothetical protein